MQSQLWPVHHKPFHDEILSSWLGRIAEGHGLSLQQFMVLCLPRPVGAGFDIDLVTDSDFLSAVAGGAGLRHEEVIQTTFAPEEGAIYAGTNTLRLEWIVQLRLRCKGERHIGLPFCPSCLGSDSTPYYRKQWRHGFSPVCPTHGILETQCPSCGHPYAHQGIRKGKTLKESGSPSYCRGCGIFFSASKQVQSEVVSSVTELQHRIYRGLSEGWIDIPGRGRVHIYQYLRGLRVLASIFHQEHGELAAAWIAKQAKVELPWDDVVPVSSVEQQTPKRRTAALFLADWLVQGWPWRFVEMANALNLPSTALLPPCSERPYWLCDAVVEQISDRRVRPSDGEIESARRVLSRQIQSPVSVEDALLFMQTQQLPRIKVRRITPTAASHVTVKESADRRAERHKQGKSLAQSHERGGRSLYQPFLSPPEGLRNELDIAEAAEDIDGLWAATRTARNTFCRDD